MSITPNLITEIKNEKDSKKADGGIIVNDKVIGVIELKGTNTTDLQKIEVQAFGYKNNQKDCVYVITSNFEKLRFYIDNAIEYEEFNLFTLSLKEFEILYLCLAYENISQGIPKKLKDESLSHEDLITKQLYKDYSLFKRELFQNLTQLNPQFEALELFKKSQKLLDRFLFLFFAEDRQLLPPNSVRLILNQWTQLKELDEYKPLYERFKKYFGYLNTGFKGKQHDIFAYNGGLFKPDEILDNILIDDEILYKNILKLSDYDFSSEVDVNILGHIFENSLNELDEIKAQLDGGEIDKSTSKRKKDGVFYTPKYITKYIVENTVGKLCTEKKSELQIIEEEYFTDKKRQIQTKKNLLDKLTRYRDWLLKITIVDPACGSGAFLNEALNFLIIEHKYIDELEAKLLGGGIVFPNVENSILENNLFGVDINEESVEIAKLSLWLRTAQPNRKLNDLNNNIKCGNSLIDDPEVAGDKAFCWEKEFPTVFANGGFDVVIGNPPYVNFVNIPSKQREFFKKNFLVAKNKTDLYAFFIEKATKITKHAGFLSFIFPHTWVSTSSFLPLRKLIIDNFQIESLAELNHGVFQDAIVKTNILICRFKFPFDGIPILNGEFTEVVIIPKEAILNNSELNINFDWNSENQKIENKIFNNSVCLESIIKFSRGIKTSNDERFLYFENKNSEYKKVIRGRNIKAYRIDYDSEYIWYRPDLMKEKIGCLPHSKEVFEVREKLITQRVNSSGQLLVAYDDSQYYCLDTTNVSITTKDNYNLKYLLVILNSKLINWWFNDKYKMPTISGYELNSIPLKELALDAQQPFIEKADIMLSLNKEIQDILLKFRNNLQREFSLEDLPTKLQNWHLLSYHDFLKEIEKKKVKLTLSQKAEWEVYFNTEHQKANEIKSKIEQTDKEIDQMVYELFELTNEEIEIVEKNIVK